MIFRRYSEKICSFCGRQLPRNVANLGDICEMCPDRSTHGENRTQQNEKITLLRKQLLQILDNACQEKIINKRERLVVSLRFALDGRPHRFEREIGQALHATRPAVRQHLYHAIFRLRKDPQFVETMNSYLRLVPYPVKWRRPHWLNNAGELEQR